MKVIKVILGIIILISIVFFATGFIVKETKYTAEVTINKHIKDVFIQFEDVETLKKWMPELKTIEPINETPQKIGSTYKMIIESEGRKVEMVEKILAYVPNEKITFHFTSKEMLKTDDYNFITQGNTTKIVQNSTIRSNSYMLACVFPWFKSRFEGISQEYMQRFKELVEQPISISQVENS